MDLVASYDSGDSDKEEDRMKTPVKQKVTVSADSPQSLQENVTGNIVSKTAAIKMEDEIITLDDSDEDDKESLRRRLLNDKSLEKSYNALRDGAQNENSDFSKASLTVPLPISLPSEVTKFSVTTPNIETCSADCATDCKLNDLNRSSPITKPVTVSVNIEEKPEKDDFDDVCEVGLYREDERIANVDKTESCHIPKIMRRLYEGHTNMVNELSWCIPKYSHLLLSASEDCTLKIWDIYLKNPVQYIKSDLGLKAAKWSFDGQLIFAGGLSRRAYVFDVLSGMPLIAYDVCSCITGIAIHPETEHVFLCGAKRMILGYDLRVNSELPIRTFFTDCEQVLDIEFLQEDSFVCCNSVNNRFPYRSIMAWHFGTGSVLAEHVYMEQCNVYSLKVHPSYSSFIAQTSDNCIVSFSAQKPYMMRNKKYVGHQVPVSGVECDISPDGKYVVSGDTNGDICFYHYETTDLICKRTLNSCVSANRVKWHPILPSIVATSTADGKVQIWK